MNVIESESLYKFFPYNPHDLDALSNNYLWFSEYSAFNDPFEDVYLENVINRELGPYDEVKAIKFYKELHRGDLPSHQVEKTLFELKMSGELEVQYNQTIRKTFEFAKNKLSEHLAESRVCCFAQNKENKLHSVISWCQCCYPYLYCHMYTHFIIFWRTKEHLSELVSIPIQRNFKGTRKCTHLLVSEGGLTLFISGYYIHAPLNLNQKRRFALQ